MSFINKIISGGQTGADLGGLVAAKRLGITTGGTAPKGFKTEKGPQPVLATYGLVEHESDKYPPRTEKNVEDSDATIVFSQNASSPGTIQTIGFAEKHSKPHTEAIDPFSESAVAETVSFLLKYKPSTLNVAGNRESKSPGITGKVAEVLATAIGTLGAGAKGTGAPKPSVSNAASSNEAAFQYRCNQETKKWEVCDCRGGDKKVVFTSEKQGFKGRLEALDEINRLESGGQ